MKPSEFLLELDYLKDKLKGYEVTLNELDKRFIYRKRVLDVIDKIKYLDKVDKILVHQLKTELGL